MTGSNGLGIGILGAGAVAQSHADAYARVAGCRIVGIAEVDEARGRAFAECHRASWYADWQRLLDHGDVDAVSVCLPHNLHAEAVIDAATRGKHVLCEKPIAITLADADRMIEACTSAGVTLMVGQTHRFWRANVLAKELLDSGAIGQVVQVRDVIFAQRNERYQRLWHGSNALSGGGILMNQGVHAADRLRWWLGSDVAWVAARTGRASGIYEGEDHGVALLAFQGGVTATMEVAVGAAPAANACYAQFLGTEGALRVDTWERVRLAKRSGDWEDVPFPADAPEAFHAEIAAFIRSARDRVQPPVTGADGRAALEIIQAIYQSVQCEGAVSLPLPPITPAKRQHAEAHHS